VYDGTLRDGYTGWWTVGGTSAATPIAAAQAAVLGIPVSAQTVYAPGTIPFRDIVAVSNGWLTLDGFDLATGRGSWAYTPGAPTGLTATATAGKVSLSWSVPSGAAVTGYKLVRGTSSAGESSTPIATVTTASYDDTTAAPGTTYFYKVAATSSAGRGPLSNETSATGVVGPGGGVRQFGNVGVGGVFVSPGAAYKFGSVFVLAEAAAVVDFRWFTRGGAVAQRFTPVVYATDAAGSPDRLVVVGSEVTVAAGQAAGWVTAGLPATSLAAGSYLLGLMSGPGDGGAANAMTVVGGAGFFNLNGYGSAAASWGVVNLEAARWSFYIDYTPVGG
jgi:hypothetical protein